jgi:hypothetical protein
MCLFTFSETGKYRDDPIVEQQLLDFLLGLRVALLSSHVASEEAWGDLPKKRDNLRDDLLSFCFGYPANHLLDKAFLEGEQLCGVNVRRMRQEALFEILRFKRDCIWIAPG